MKFQLSHYANMRHSRFHTGDAYQECSDTCPGQQQDYLSLPETERRAPKAALNRHNARENVPEAFPLML